MNKTTEQAKTIQAEGIKFDEFKRLAALGEIGKVTAYYTKPGATSKDDKGYIIYVTRKGNSEEQKEVLIASTSQEVRYIKTPNTLATTLKDLGVDCADINAENL
ncbi:MAG: hypothetical protein KZQ74_01280 [gamma proteobacterium symbiont of Bathyaustriella thionipta]|nr:hypothetical protein [gamma proteobacterium symbiont of Bathyaustriella thionipta]MCU7951646.1 hypothetical protein [gamma proteobacterium symbiont of Bathyaustriella thionipta]MCU7958246.1 hypothetical protein [gamma proteobacterium symbiont of Bathyaustriella thionipta]MCU7965838.1 hypothetical protein [gamma proteobacterium symbiont of Bathyaustriella thionipta]